jgi:hypothetical protein
MPKKEQKKISQSQQLKNVINIKIGDKVSKRKRKVVRRKKQIEPSVQLPPINQPNIQTYKINLGNIAEETKAINDRNNATFKEVELANKMIELERKREEELRRRPEGEILKKDRLPAINPLRSQPIKTEEITTPILEEEKQDYTVKVENQLFEGRKKSINPKRDDIYKTEISDADEVEITNPLLNNNRLYNPLLDENNDFVTGRSKSRKTRMEGQNKELRKSLISMYFIGAPLLKNSDEDYKDFKNYWKKQMSELNGKKPKIPSRKEFAVLINDNNE